MPKVATFNTQNLNSADLWFIGRETDRPYTQEELDKKSNSIAERLDKIKADIVGFQEIFSYDALATSVKKSSYMKDAQVFVPGAEIAVDPISQRKIATGPLVGLASKFPLKGEPQSIKAFPDEMHILVPTGLHGLGGDIHQISIRQFERPVLKAEIEVDGLPGLTVFVAHLKSKRPKFLTGEFTSDPIVTALGDLRSLIVRAAEAAALRALIVKARNEWVDGRRRPVILLGDVNDDIDAVTTQMLVGARPFGDRNNKISRRDYHFRTIDLMLSAFEIQPPKNDKLYTHVYDGKGEVLDMIMVSADFFGVAGEQRAKISETDILNDHLEFAPTKITELPTPYDYKDQLDKDWLNDDEPKNRFSAPKLGFDHGIPTATFELIPAAN